jgi:uncharacterized membrane protein
MKIPPIRTLTRIVIGLLFAGLGLSHLVDPAPFVSIMPPYLPWHLELVYISGFFEIYLDGMPPGKWLLWVRMPMQLVFAIGVLWVGEIWPRQPRVEAEEKAGD